MEHTGHVRIDRKDIPYYLLDDKVILIPHNTYSMFFPSEVKSKEIIKGATTGNRNVLFLNCKYNVNSLAYQVMIISEYNTGLYMDITKFDRICFEGVPVNVFAGPGNAYVSEEGFDISRRMKAITPRDWEDLNIETNTKIKSQKIKLSLDYLIQHNKKHSETSMGAAIPRFCVEYEKTKSINKIPETYYMVYDFFVFLNFRHNVRFEKVYIQRKVEGKYKTIARVFIKSHDWGTYASNEKNTIIIDDVKQDFGKLFKNIATRRQKRIYDDFFIPCNDEENMKISYETFLSCALSFESEYSRTYPSKRDEKEKYAYLQNLFIDSAEKLNELILSFNEGIVSKEDFEKLYFGMVNPVIKNKLDSTSKTQAKEYKGYYDNIINTLSKIDYSLGEKYKKALDMHKEKVLPVIDRMCNENKISFPSNHEAGTIFADFRNGIAHGNPDEIKLIHCVLYEVARALIYVLVLSNSGVSDNTIKLIIKKIF